MAERIKDVNSREHWINEQITKYNLENIHSIQFPNWNVMHNELISCYKNGLDVATIICIDVAINSFFIQKINPEFTVKKSDKYKENQRISRKSTSTLINEAFFLKDDLKKEINDFLLNIRNRIVHPIEPTAIWKLGSQYEYSYDNSKVTHYKTKIKTIDDFKKVISGQLNLRE